MSSSEDIDRYVGRVFTKHSMVKNKGKKKEKNEIENPKQPNHGKRMT